MVTFSIAMKWRWYFILVLLQSINIHITDAFAISKLNSAHDVHKSSSRDRFAAASSCNTKRYNINKPYIMQNSITASSASISGCWSGDIKRHNKMMMATISDDVSSIDDYNRNTNFQTYTPYLVYYPHWHGLQHH